jgi:hypothetical protein
MSDVCVAKQFERIVIMTTLRKRAASLYPLLNISNKKEALKAVRRLDKALDGVRGVISREDPKSMELLHACDFASTILSN